MLLDHSMELKIDGESLYRATALQDEQFLTYVRNVAILI